MSMLRGLLQEFLMPFLNTAEQYARTSRRAMGSLKNITVATMLKFRESPIQVNYSL